MPPFGSPRKLACLLPALGRIWAFAHSQTRERNVLRYDVVTVRGFFGEGGAVVFAERGPLAFLLLASLRLTKENLVVSARWALSRFGLTRETTDVLRSLTRGIHPQQLLPGCTPLEHYWSTGMSTAMACCS